MTLFCVGLARVFRFVATAVKSTKFFNSARFLRLARSTKFVKNLAHTGDVGEALRPVISDRIVETSLAITAVYILADVGWEAYKLHKRGYQSDSDEVTAIAQCVVQRTTFQVLASVVIPAAIINTSMKVSTQFFHRVGRFQRWGPSVVGLAIIPLLPLVVDKPVENGVDWLFARFSPWSQPAGRK